MIGFDSDLAAPAVARMTLSERLAKACREADISVADACGRNRTQLICRRRDHVMAILRAAGWSLPRIGHVLGGRDHTTIWAGLKRWEVLLADPASSDPSTASGPPPHQDGAEREEVI